MGAAGAERERIRHHDNLQQPRGLSRPLRPPMAALAATEPYSGRARHRRERGRQRLCDRRRFDQRRFVRDRHRGHGRKFLPSRWRRRVRDGHGRGLFRDRQGCRLGHAQRRRGRAWGGDSPGPGGSADLNNAVIGSTAGQLVLQQTAIGGFSPSAAGEGGAAGGEASSNLTFTNSTAASLEGRTTAIGGQGASEPLGFGPGGAATAAMTLTGARAVTAASVAEGGAAGGARASSTSA